MILYGLLLAPSMCAAADLAEGLWNGIWTSNSGDEVAAVFKVTGSPGGYSMIMYVDERPSDIEEIVVEDGELRFELVRGPGYCCTLTSEDDHRFSGECRPRDEEQSVDSCEALEAAEPRRITMKMLAEAP